MRQLTFATADTNTDLRVIQLTLAYAEGTLTGTRAIQLNRPPVAGDVVFVAQQGIAIAIPFSEVLANVTDADHDVLSVTDYNFESAQGGRITMTGSQFTYVSPTTPGLKKDTFAYLVEDGRGGQCVGFIDINFVVQNQLKIALSHDRTVHLTMGGAPGHIYRVDVSDDLIQWTPMGTVTANSMGVIEIVDTPANDSARRFYRAVAQ